MDKIVSLTEEQLNGLVANKAQFDKLHVAGRSSKVSRLLILS